MTHDDDPNVTILQLRAVLADSRRSLDICVASLHRAARERDGLRAALDTAHAHIGALLAFDVDEDARNAALAWLRREARNDDTRRL